ncbi:MAG: hypothetical protein ACXW4B_05425 [Micavibrio sp.]
MQKHLGLTGLFTGFAAFLSATGVQAQTTQPQAVPTPDALTAAPLNLTPVRGFDGDFLNPRPLMQDRTYGPRLDEGDGFAPRPLELRSRFRIEESAGSGFVDRIRSGDLARREIGGGSLSLRVKKGLSIRYKIEF